MARSLSALMVVKQISWSIWPPIRPFLKRDFDVPTSRWDYSIESLRALDDLLCPQKKPQPVFPRALVDSVIAYCGEVLRSQLGGHWFLFTCEADEIGGERYFPSITLPTGAHLDFAALVEEEFESPIDSRLYDHMKRLITSPLPLPVQQWQAHPAGFPAVEKTF